MPIGLGVGLGGSGGSAGNPQQFDYAFTGAETARFQVTLPTVRAATTYGVAGAIRAPDGGANTYTWTYDTKTVDGFFVNTSAQVPAGYKLTLTVEDLR